MHEKKENTGKVGSVIRWLVVVIAAGVFLYAGYQVYLYFAENNESQVEIDDLADKAVTIVKPETKPEKEEEMVTEILTEREEESEGETGPVVIGDAQGFAKYLLKKAAVAVVPGDAFETPNAVRFAYPVSVETINEGMDRIEAALKELK